MIPYKYNLSEEQYAERINKAEQAGEASVDLALNESVWGIEYYGDAPPAIGGGISGFSWFRSQEELFEFVAEHLIFIYPAVGTAVPSRAWEEVDGIVAQVRDGSLDFKAGMAALNQSLKQISQVQWWGPMTDLLRGSGAFQERARGWFRETALGTDDKSPLKAEEHAAFFEELRFWGA